jgi:hypothetical protein
MPIFTLGFSTKRNDIPEMVLKQLAKMTSECRNMGEYWIFENAILNSVPMYMINKNGLFILTNDENLALENSNGYGPNKLPRKQVKEIKKQGFAYAQVDWSKTVTSVPPEVLNPKQEEILNALKGHTGKMTLTSSKTTQQKTEFVIDYQFEGDQPNSSKYILDLVNSLYVILK